MKNNGWQEGYGFNIFILLYNFIIIYVFLIKRKYSGQTYYYYSGILTNLMKFVKNLFNLRWMEK